ncbi:uncharacterized protein LOC105687877 isoform X1 [Athalia rosae]|uniref:uncharacterized protein LOC105687877 isoform X1 n=1 Tax=Athalia rosae TaxID=37344 RepID=UPI0020333A26|nr:uncharacterized protein LOC105687877 isoform X1 [Athalia rosae]XP_048513139.1 uncharacterized protein LOC105687877 isoform X1 [Athalia rosae]
MSENIETVCNAGGDSVVQIASEAPSSLPVQNTGDAIIVPVVDSPTQSEEDAKPRAVPTLVEDQSPKESLSLQEGNNPPQKDLVTSETNGNESNTAAEVSKLESEIQKRTHERDNYQRKLGETERKLAALQASYTAVTSGNGDEITLRREKEDLKNMLTQTQLMLDDRGRLVANQQTQINALSKQVSSLKEVVAITKDLLNIRNMEVKHLQNDVDSMESKITAERDRHNTMLSKMDAAVRLNADLKKEYETQLHLFQDLRGKYEQKVTLLSEENRALEAASQSAVV